jgi:hypothetical protein
MLNAKKLPLTTKIIPKMKFRFFCTGTPVTYIKLFGAEDLRKVGIN